KEVRLRMRRIPVRSNATFHVLRRVALALVLIELAAFLSVMLGGWPTPFLLFYPAILAAAWIGGRVAGFIATVAALLALDYFLLEPIAAFGVTKERDQVDLIIFCGISLLLTHFMSRTRDALRDARDAAHAAQVATEAKDRVLALVAHDLRNPLQTIA